MYHIITHLRVLFAVVVTLLLIPPISAFAQANVIWNRIHGGNDYDGCNALKQTSDGGFILAGYTMSSVTSLSDFLLFRTNADGDSLWKRNFGGSGNERCNSVYQTTDGGFVLGGWTDSFGSGFEDFWMVRTDENGDSLWSRTFGGASYEECYSIIQTNDGGYLLGGWTHSFGLGASDFWMIKTDENGDSLWSRIFGGDAQSGEDVCRVVQQTNDGGYMLAGWTTFGAPQRNFWLVRTDADGNSIWPNWQDHTYGGSAEDLCYSATQTNDGGFILVGSSNSTSIGNDGSGDYWVVKTDSNGDEEWNQNFGGTSADYAESVIQTNDGGFAFVGTSYSFGTIPEFWLVQTDSDGDSLWSRTFHLRMINNAHALVQDSNDAFYMAGYVEQNVLGGDCWLVKAEVPVDTLYTWTTGTLSPNTATGGEFNVPTALSMIVAGDETKTLEGLELDIEGSAQMQDSGNFVFLYGAVVNVGETGALDIGPEFEMSGGGTFYNSGESSFDAQADSILIDVSVINSTIARTPGTIEILSGTVVFGDGGSNNGIVNLHESSQWIISGDYVNTGTITIASGATLRILGTFLNDVSGVISGNGTIDISNAISFINNGTISPGASPGMLTVNGNLNLGASSVLQLEIAGSNSTDYDRLNVSGSFELGGTLALSLQNNYIPQSSDNLQILSAGTWNGEFDNITGTEIGNGQYLNLSFGPGGMGVSLLSGLNPIIHVHQMNADSARLTWRKVSGAISYVVHSDTVSNGLFETTQSVAAPDTILIVPALNDQQFFFITADFE